MDGPLRRSSLTVEREENLETKEAYIHKRFMYT
jgi:hypothetical protein